MFFLSEFNKVPYLAELLERCKKNVGVLVVLAPIFGCMIEKWAVHYSVFREGVNNLLQVTVVLHRVVGSEKVVHGHNRVLWITNDVNDLY